MMMEKNGNGVSDRAIIPERNTAVGRGGSSVAGKAKWTVNRSIVEIRARELELLGGRNVNQSSPEGEAPSERSTLFNEDDDIPF